MQPAENNFIFLNSFTSTVGCKFSTKDHA